MRKIINFSIICLICFSVFFSFATSAAGDINGQGYGAYFVEGSDQTNKIIQTADGGAVIVSLTSSYVWSSAPANFTDELTKAMSRLFLIKIDSNGIEQWRRVVGPEGYNITSKQIGTADPTVHWAGTSVVQSGTDLIVTGYNGTVGAVQGINARLMKFDSSGGIIWDREFNDPRDGNDYFFDIVERTGGGFATVGNAHGPSYDSDGWLVLTDINGQNPTYHYYKTNGLTQEYLRTIRKTSDGGYIMAGYTDYGLGTEDYYVAKAASDGTLQWAHKFDNAGRWDKATGVEEDSNGNFWVFGRSQKPGVENTKIWIVKLNASGEYQASFEIGDNLDADAYVGRGSLRLPNGNFLVMGYTNVISGQGYNSYIAEIDNSGSIVGAPKIVGADNSGSEDYLFSGVVSGDGLNYLLAGTNNGAFSTAYDIWFLKLAVIDKSVQNFTVCPSKTNYYYDKDLDGFGNNNQWSEPTASVCVQMPGYVLNNIDNDDSVPLSYDTIPPSAPTGVKAQ